MATIDSKHDPYYGGYLRVHLEPSYYSPGVTKVKWWVTAHGRSSSPTYLATDGDIYVNYRDSSGKSARQQLDLTPYHIYYTGNQVGSVQTFYAYHDSSGNSGLTITFSNLIIYSGGLSSSSTYWLSNNKPYTSCGAPSNLKFNKQYAIPGSTVTVSWTAGKAGIANSVKGYTIAYGLTNQGWTYKDITSTSYTFTVDESWRNLGMEVKVLTRGSAGASYNSSYSPKSVIYTNKIPPKPKLTTSKDLIPSTQDNFNIEIKANLTDEDRYNNMANQFLKIYEYNPITQKYDILIRDESSSQETVTVTRPAANPNESVTYKYKTWDGYEFSPSSEITVTRNKKPSITIETYNNIKYRSGNTIADDDVFTESGQYPNEILYVGKTTLNYYANGYQLLKRNFILKEKIIFNKKGTDYIYSSKEYPINDYRASLTHDILDEVKELGVKWRIELFVDDGLEKSETISFPTPSGNKKYYYIPTIIIDNIYNQYDSQDKKYSNPNTFFKQLRVYYKTNTGMPLQYILLINSNDTSDRIQTQIVNEVDNHNGTCYVDLLVENTSENKIYTPSIGFKNINTNNYILVNYNNFKLKSDVKLQLFNLSPASIKINGYTTTSDITRLIVRHPFNRGLSELNGKKYFKDNNLNPESEWLKIFIVNPNNLTKKMQLQYDISNDTTDNDLIITINWNNNKYDFINNPLDIPEDTNVTENIIFEIVDVFGKNSQTIFSDSFNYIFITNSFVENNIIINARKEEQGLDYNFDTNTNWLQKDLIIHLTNEIKSYNNSLFLPSIEIKYYTDKLENSSIFEETLYVDNNNITTSHSNSNTPTSYIYNTIFKIPRLKQYPYCKIKIKYKEVSGKNYEISTEWSNYLTVGFLENVKGILDSKALIENNINKNKFNINYTINNLNYNKNLNNKIIFELVTSKDASFVNSTSFLLKDIQIIEETAQNKIVTIPLPDNNINWDFLYQSIKTTSILTQTFINSSSSIEITTKSIGYTTPYIVYNITPTLAYRNGCLGINTFVVDTTSVLDINATTGKYKVTFSIPGDSHSQGEIMMGNGQSDGPEKCFLNEFVIDGGEW